MDNLPGSIIDLITSEEGNPASGYLGGQFKEVTDQYRVTNFEIKHPNLCRKICTRSLQVDTSFSSDVITSHLSL